MATAHPTQPTTDTHRPIPDFPGYRVSRTGVVGVLRPSGWTVCKQWDRHGYKAVYIRNGYWRGQLYVHRLVLLAFAGPCPQGMQCRHLNGDPADNRLENLAWGTPTENRADCLAHGRAGMTRGERNAAAKLTAEQVSFIRRALCAGARPGPLAVQYGVSVVTIKEISRGHTWKHVPGPDAVIPRRRRASLTPDEEEDVRRRYAAGERVCSIAADYVIDQSSISRIARGIKRTRRKA